MQSAPPLLPLQARSLAVAVAVCLPALQAHATGGHFAISDATILEPGTCELEGWYSRSPAQARLLHAEAGCRVGPVELNAEADREWQPGQSQTDWGLGLKWAAPLGAGISVGASLGPSWQARARPRYQGASGVLLLTWEATEQLALHANLGRDFARSGQDQPRGGVSASWAVRDWTFVVERFRSEQSHFMRAGLRWQAARGWTLDLSRSRRIAGPGSSSWTVGLSREFERP